MALLPKGACGRVSAGFRTRRITTVAIAALCRNAIRSADLHAFKRNSDPNIFQVDQFTTLANLYSQLGLMRKSAFYSRVAAMVCVAPSSKKESWPQCYGLLLQSLPGFKLSLDCRDMIESPSLFIVNDMNDNSAMSCYY